MDENKPLSMHSEDIEMSNKNDFDLKKFVN